MLATGCGEARTVTYVDPNGADSAVPEGSGGEPVVRHGVAALERARACVDVRGSLAVARTIAVDDPERAGEVIELSLEQDLPTIEARATATAPRAASELRAGLERLRDEPPADVAAYNLEVRRLSEQLLVAACDAVVPAAARQDASFRAAVLHETLQDAATSYEEAFDGGDAVEYPDAYRRAYGLLIDASTRQLEAIPADARPRIRQQLDAITRRATPGPTPPASPHDPELVSGDLAALADEVLVATLIDTTFPEPPIDTPDQLRSLKRGIAAAVEAFERDATQDALQQLRAADRASLVPAAAGLSAVSPSTLTQLEQGVLVDLPDAIRAGGDVAAIASELDVAIDEAISLVEEELELLREG